MHDRFKIATTSEQLLLHIYEEQQKTNKLLKELIDRLGTQPQPETAVRVQAIVEPEEKPKRRRSKGEVE